MPSRRDTIKLGAAAGLVLALPTDRLLAAVAGERAAAAEPFTVPLPIPPVLRPVGRDAAADHYRITVGRAKAEILPGQETEVYTYNGSFPGPMIRARRGRAATVTVANGLDTPTAMHLHGGEVPQSSDGYPTHVIQPGGSRTYHYPNRQPAATLWYHDHAHHLEAEQIYRGLAGLYVIEEPDGLPTGKYDVPLMLRDAAFADGGQLLWQIGGQPLRNTVLVNGVPQPVLAVERRKYRLRILNCANERVFRLRLTGGTPFVQVGVDCGHIAVPVRRTELEIYPAERLEVIVDFSRFGPGSTLVLENADGTAAADTGLLRFVVGGGRVRDDSEIPARLATAPAVPALRGGPAQIRKIELGFDKATTTFLINGRTFDPGRDDFTVKRGTTEIWEITNKDVAPLAIPHSMHLHLVRFRVLSRGGVPVKPWESYPKDTVPVPPGQTVRILVSFTSEFTGRYPFHCHFNDHSSLGMMAQMNIVP
ncbi:MAG TPA: multicopper oxidase domain-containing protein [Actinophytocola sp.]|jgi:FtsP/CotA-like multicopper oxidase with cupredoxin domain|uniref:multicopper oxidase family protein n=1 Tax=Actinophytocola sp. TaxID=1872138 RepID=UPI002F9227E8